MQYGKFTSSDIERIGILQPEGWSDITEAFRFYTSHDYCNPVKVTVDHEIVGIGSSILFEKSAWLAHIIVNADFRNRGIGYGIVEYLQDDVGSKGIETSLLIATEMGEPVYLKAGFRHVSDYRFFKRDPALTEAPFSDQIQAYHRDFYADIIRLDRLISGENRERLLQGHLDDSLVFLENKTVCGYYIPGLGEGPISATTVEAGRELMRLKYSTVEKATIPGENRAGIEYLHELGFVETEIKGKRMILGKDIAWKPEMIYSRTGGNFG